MKQQEKGCIKRMHWYAANPAAAAGRAFFRHALENFNESNMYKM